MDRGHVPERRPRLPPQRLYPEREDIRQRREHRLNHNRLSRNLQHSNSKCPSFQLHNLTQPTVLPSGKRIPGAQTPPPTTTGPDARPGMLRSHRCGKHLHYR